MAQPPKVRERVREALKAYPTGVYPASGDDVIDAIVDAVLSVPETIRVFGVLVVYEGSIEALAIYNVAHPSIGPGYTTNPLFSCGHGIRALTDAERRDAVDAEAIENEYRRDAHTKCLTEANQLVADPRFAWAGPLVSAHEFAPGLGSYRSGARRLLAGRVSEQRALFERVSAELNKRHDSAERWFNAGAEYGRHTPASFSPGPQHREFLAQWDKSKEG